MFCQGWRCVCSSYVAGSRRCLCSSHVDIVWPLPFQGRFELCLCCGATYEVAYYLLTPWLDSPMHATGDAVEVFGVDLN